jgi:hypothetical protein
VFLLFRCHRALGVRIRSLRYRLFASVFAVTLLRPLPRCFCAFDFHWGVVWAKVESGPRPHFSKLLRTLTFSIPTSTELPAISVVRNVVFGKASSQRAEAFKYICFVLMVVVCGLVWEETSGYYLWNLLERVVCVRRFVVLCCVGLWMFFGFLACRVEPSVVVWMIVEKNLGICVNVGSFKF